MIATCSPVRAEEKIMTNPDAQLIDVREYPEYAGGHAKGAVLIPLSSFEKEMGKIIKGKPVVVLCQAGVRAAKAAAILEKAGYTDVTVVEGGTKAWQAADLPMEVASQKIWSLERQVRLAAGALVLIGLFLPGGFPWLSAFVGAGLMFAAVTNTCGMGMLIARMPWNRAPEIQRSSCVVGGKSCSSSKSL